MSFENILRKIVDECGGGLAIALMGSDGLPIAQIDATAAGAERIEDISAAGVEFGRILDEVRKASDSLDGGAPRECVFVLTHFSVIVRAIDDESFIALALGVNGNLGKARYLIRRHLDSIREEL